MLFWAATLGFGFGSLEFYSIIIHPLYPLADLSSAFYSAVFYWAIFRYNYMGGRSLLKWFLLRAGTFFVAFVISLSAILIVLHLAPWFERPWVPAVLMALLLSALVPMLYLAFNNLRQHYFPAQYSGRDLLLETSAIASTAQNSIAMAELILAEMERTFNYPRIALVLFRSCRPNETPPHLITHHLPLTSLQIHCLNRVYSSAISKRELLDSLRQLSQPNSLRKRGLLRDYRLLRRLNADILVPCYSEEGLELVLIADEGRYRTEDWKSTAPMLEGVCKLLADHLYLRRITETRVQERHLGDLGLMAAGLAHEIKNPLEGIYGAAQILQEEAKGNPRFVEMILKDSMRLNDIVQAFLKFARPYPIQLQPIALVNFLQAFARQQTGLINITAPENLSVQADPNGLQQILVNLTQNAWRVQPKEIPIRLSVQTQGSVVELSVSDDGPGITPEQSQHLFKPFYTTAAQGNGLGLALSRKIAHAMGGDLYFVPQNKGACFSVKLLVS
jgi:signal transduction histidine kinase